MEDLTTPTFPEDKSIEHILTDQAKFYLRSAAGWAHFLAVCMFILTGFLVLAGVVILFVAPLKTIGRFEAIIPLIYLVFLPALYIWLGIILHRFAKYSKLASQDPTSYHLEKAFKYLRTYFAFLGAIIIAFVVIYVIGMLFLGIGGVYSFMDSN